MSFIPAEGVVELVDKEDYYKDNTAASFSGLKVFSKCETLYRDLFVTKVYEEPDHDYFTYGKLVDAMVSEPEDFIPKNFVKVERRVNPEDALEIENKMKGLYEEVDDKEKEQHETMTAKKVALLEKVGEARKKLNDKVMAKPNGDYSKEMAKIQQLEVAATVPIEPNKTLEKGIASRREEIAECHAKLQVIADYADKIQVTEALWKNSEETAAALKAHPSYVTMEFNGLTSQQIFKIKIDGVMCKGKLDHLKLSPALTKLYAIYVAKQITLEQLQLKIQTDIHPTDLWAIITDIKTCKDLKELEPYNNHYRGQLGWYQMLVSNVLLIPRKNIRTRILAADKMNNDFKKCELFEYTEEAVTELHGDVLAWCKIWQDRQQHGGYQSSKEKFGLNQTCFTCTECRFCPFSKKPGEPVLVTGPRFPAKQPRVQVDSANEISTAEAALDY